MQKLLDKLARLKRRVMNAENRTKRVLIAGKVHIVNEEGKFASNLKEKWAIK
tara:strand:+ start:282 stop:437 length:156 start_codon:yes stop_codon:yes gene_type:complete